MPVRYTVRNRREYATEYTVFDRINADGTISDVKHYNMTELELKLRYGKNEKFYQTRNSRVPITFDALIFNFSHVMAKYNPQIEMFARFKMKSSFHKTKRII